MTSKIAGSQMPPKRVVTKWGRITMAFFCEQGRPHPHLEDAILCNQVSAESQAMLLQEAIGAGF